MNTTFSLSLKLLLYELKMRYESSDLIEKNPHFTGFELYTPSAKWKKSHLIVGMLSEILPVASSYSKTNFLCIRDRFTDEEEHPSIRRNVLILVTNKKLAQVFNEILAIFARFREWDMKMNLSVTSNQGIQPLLDLSEDIIGNHIDIMDSTFKLQGYTRSIDLDDEITQDLINYGYHNDDTVQKFLELRRFEEYETKNDIIVSDDYKLCKYVTLKRVFHLNNKPSLYVVMHCNHREADDSLQDLFRMFLNYVEKYALKDYFHPSTFAASQQYIRDLFDGNIANVDEAISRASYATIPFQQDYQLYIIAFDDNFNTPLDKLAIDINQNLPFSYVLTYHRRIAVLHNLRKNEDNTGTVRIVLERFLAKFPCMIGISNPFKNLWESRTALEQAGCAIEYGSHMRRTLTQTEASPIAFYDFEQSILTLIVAKSYNTTPDLFKNSFMFRAIQTLLEYDKEHSSNLFRTLETYLNSNQKATETCEKLHMHRNTVLYHIDRIERLLDISLSDPETSIKLLLGIKTYQSNMIEVLL